MNNLQWFRWNTTEVVKTKRASPIFARDFIIASRSTCPGFSQDDPQTGKDNHELALSLFVSC